MGEPSESSGASMEEGHETPPERKSELITEIVVVVSSDGPSIIICAVDPNLEAEPLRVAAPDDTFHGAADRVEVRVRQVEPEGHRLDDGCALSAGGRRRQQPPRRGGVRRHDSIDGVEGRRVGTSVMRYQVVDVDSEVGERARDVPPSSREGADPHRRAQVQVLHDVEQYIVGQSDEPVSG